jgi:hypothetical protein
VVQNVVSGHSATLVHGGVDAHAQAAREHRTDLAEHAQADAVDRIGQPVGVALARQPQASSIAISKKKTGWQGR